ncbi:MAG: CopG family ribbon-helix-helix protein [Thermodesulfobacteriota bacterium]|nr:CopG family ribbon-helix-helix protein [Thermodesulfobacteriota bacterium]
MGATLTIRIDDQIKKRLEHLARATARSKSYLVNSAIKEFIAANEWQVQEIENAVKKADQPDAKFIDHEEVSAWLDTWGSNKEKDPPKCE